MENDTDVLEFDFPDYEEPYPPFPDVKTADFDKEESYGRNRDIADRLYADELKEKERRAKKLRKAVHKRRKHISRSKNTRSEEYFPLSLCSCLSKCRRCLFPSAGESGLSVLFLRAINPPI